MERDNKKISIIYILTGIIILLVIYLVLFVYKTYNVEEEKEEDTVDLKLPEVATSCTFDMTMNEFNNIESNTDLCGTVNKINLTDVNVNGQKLDAIVYYSNSSNSKSGIYINNAAITEMANSEIKHKLYAFGDKLFVTTESNTNASFDVYDANMTIIYSLEETLNNLQITDPTFEVLAQTNPSLPTVLTTDFIDGNSFKFENGQITFNSTSRLTCTPGSASGSSYIITYDGNKFEDPTFVSGVTC